MAAKPSIKLDLEALDKENLESELEESAGTKVQDPALGRMFSLFLEQIIDLDSKFSEREHPLSARSVRDDAVKAIALLDEVISKALKAGWRPDSAPEGMVLKELPRPACLVAVALALGEVNAGRRSPLFSPGGPESGKVKLPVRAIAAAALHVMVEERIAPLETAAEQISERLAKLSIYRSGEEDELSSLIPAPTICGWRDTRRKQSEAFKQLFSKSLAYVFFRRLKLHKNPFRSGYSKP